MSHSTTICKHCRRVVDTCRCASKKKVMSYVDTCPACRGAKSYKREGPPKTFVDAVQEGEAIPEDFKKWLDLGFMSVNKIIGVSTEELDMMLHGGQEGVEKVLKAHGIIEDNHEDQDSSGH